MSKGPLIGEDGNISEVGYALSNVKRFDKCTMNASYMRLMASECFTFINKDGLIAELSMYDHGYCGAFLINILQEGKELISYVCKCPFSMQRMNISDYSAFGQMKLSVKTDTMTVIETENGLKLLAYSIMSDKKIKCEIELTETSPECCFISESVEDRKSLFFSSMTKTDYKANGTVTVGDGVWNIGEDTAVIRHSERSAVMKGFSYKASVSSSHCDISSSYFNHNEIYSFECGCGVYHKRENTHNLKLIPISEPIVTSPFLGFTKTRRYFECDGSYGYEEYILYGQNKK